MITETALVKLETFTAVQIFEPGFIDPLLENIETEARAEAAKLDISTESNRKALASLAYKVARSKTFIDNQRKELVADEKRRLKKIDEEGRRIWDRLESLSKEIRKPLTEWEEKDKVRVEGHQKALAELEFLTAQVDWQRSGVDQMKADLSAALSAHRDWEEFSSRGSLAQKQLVEKLTAAIAQREKYDAEQAELERLRREAAEREQKEREERIAREAREKAEKEAREREENQRKAAELESARLEAAKKEAEAKAHAAEEARIAAEEKAKRDAIEAEERAKRLASEAAEREKRLLKEAEERRALQSKEAAERAEREKQAAIEAERKRLAEEVSKAKAEQQRREQDKSHRAKINGEAKAALLNHTNLSAENAEEVIRAIAKGLVIHVTIQY